MRRVRVLHYNVAGCVGGFDDLLEQIRAAAPDVVTLNEVRRMQATSFARSLDKHAVWSGGWRHAIANAVLVPSAPQHRAVMRLPRTRGMARRSVAIATWQGVRWAGAHLGLDAAERAHHAALLARIDEPVVLGIDCNERPGGSAWSALSQRMRDVGPAQPTFPAIAPDARIDTVFASASITAEGSFVMEEGRSDHRGVVVDLLIQDAR